MHDHCYLDMSIPLQTIIDHLRFSMAKMVGNKVLSQSLCNLDFWTHMQKKFTAVAQYERRVIYMNQYTEITPDWIG